MDDIKEGTPNFSKGFGIMSFVLSLIGLLMISTYFMFGLTVVIPALILGILGLIFSIVQFKKGKTGLAIAGLVLSIIVIVIGILNIVSVLLVEKVVDSSINEGTQLIDQQIAELNK